ncbi:phosphotransferase [Phytomonospora sp. NPDC050363]|uniref:phosphotransferase family protein n=1 Tax=Phytomonospora sp. NPDC050363 TaxID=3155642 RepID=UPI0033DAE13D
MLTTAPPAAALTWAASVAGPRATITAVTELGGGMHAATHLITTENPWTETVLRRFEPGDDAAEREAHILSALSILGGLDGFAPALLAADPGGELFGEPAVLISKLPGHGNITPTDPLDWATQLGRALARLHALPISAGFRDRITETKPPQHPHVAESWDEMSSQPRVFSHVDYWSGNTVWTDQNLTGIVDWSAAGTAPRAYDLSWCRDDIMLIHDDETVADAFLAAYESESGTKIHDIFLWDLWTASRTLEHVHTWSKGYIDLGRPDMTGAFLTARKSAWLARLDARI